MCIKIYIYIYIYIKVVWVLRSLVAIADVITRSTTYLGSWKDTCVLKQYSLAFCDCCISVLYCLQISTVDSQQCHASVTHFPLSSISNNRLIWGYDCFLLYFIILYYIQNYEYKKKTCFLKLCFDGLDI
jgi:hypothetical protein